MTRRAGSRCTGAHAHHHHPRRHRHLLQGLGRGPGCPPQPRLARQELRAAGEASPTRAIAAAERLTGQELEIARLAATGLTNREIGQQLYLSHRMVGSHLYHVFPKLVISSRAELAAALGEAGSAGAAV
jgi:DNA-binding NarL/FixJ family response regulator